MEMFIKLENGQPEGHPIMGDNFRRVFPQIDPNNPAPEFAKFVHCGKDDEKWLTEIKPAEREKPNCIYGRFLAVHYAYYTQRKELDNQPQILEQFRVLSREIKNG